MSALATAARRVAATLAALVLAAAPLPAQRAASATLMATAMVMPGAPAPAFHAPIVVQERGGASTVSRVRQAAHGAYSLWVELDVRGAGEAMPVVTLRDARGGSRPLHPGRQEWVHGTRRAPDEPESEVVVRGDAAKGGAAGQVVLRYTIVPEGY